MRKIVDEFKGVRLFNDIEDEALRNGNRAVVMANIFEDNVNKEGKVTDKGSALLIGYFGCIKEEERKGVYSRVEAELKKRGYTEEK